MIHNPVIQNGGTDIETCTLNVDGNVMNYGSINCSIWFNGDVKSYDEFVQGNGTTIENVIVGSVVTFTNGDTYTSTYPNDGVDPNLRFISTGVFQIMGDAHVDMICCFVKGTRISVHSGGYKLVEDITYDDELLAWDFDNGRFTYNKPCWIKKEEVASHYYKCTFSNGTELKLVGYDGKCHRVFSIDDNEFLSATDCVGKHVATKDGLAILLSCECVNDPVEFYNIITECHMNLFAENVLTSCRLNNLYPIQDMKFVKDDRPAMPIDRYSKVAQKYYDALRLGERDEDDIAWVNAYVERIDSISDAQKLCLRNKQS